MLGCILASSIWGNCDLGALYKSNSYGLVGNTWGLRPIMINNHACFRASVADQESKMLQASTLFWIGLELHPG